MHRLLLIILLLCLPLQTSWAAVSVYCKHETGPATQHLGHHVHQHSNANDPTTEGSSFSPKHQDCEACHSHLTCVFPESDLASDNQPSAMRDFSPLEPASAFQSGPERPKWRSSDCPASGCMLI